MDGTPLSFAALPLPLKRQYRALQIYSFIWWWFYSYYLVFQPLYLAELGFSLPEIFINAALAPILSLFFENWWSKIVDSTQKIKKYIIIGNICLAIASFFTIHVSSFWMVLILTAIFRMGPNSDALASTLVYRLSDKCVLSKTDDLVERKYHNINLFALYRRFGSIGWAIALPFMGLIVNVTGLGINFQACAVGMLVVSVGIHRYVDESIILTGSSQETSSKKTISNSVIKGSLFLNLRQLFSNRVYLALLIASLLYSMAYYSTYQVQGLFYNLFSRDNYFELVWIYSIAAFVEWPAMTIIARQVNRIGWEKMITWSYIFTGLRLAFVPFVLILNGNIWWGYALQIFTGILFGFRWPTTTFGVYISLSDKQKAIGQTFFNTINLFGTFVGNLIGALLSFLLENETYAFYGIHWVAGILSILSGILFFSFIYKKK